MGHYFLVYICAQSLMTIIIVVDFTSLILTFKQLPVNFFPIIFRFRKDNQNLAKIYWGNFTLKVYFEKGTLSPYVYSCTASNDKEELDLLIGCYVRNDKIFDTVIFSCCQSKCLLPDSRLTCCARRNNRCNLRSNCNFENLE